MFRFVSDLNVDKKKYIIYMYFKLATFNVILHKY